ncbi:MAG: PD-(D/E)XK nuclease family protein [PVC group bacterium]|nr:PD-(D/E)XK nuclease family protein [PVC group bacterium]
MENRFKDFWERPEVDWHEKIPHHYHVSQVGMDHSNKDASEHYGPCLRQSFYRILDPIPEAPSSRGNLFMGNVLHEIMQTEEKKKNPSSIMEFPLYLEFERNGQKISISGSVDIVDFERNSFPQLVNVIDIKTASSYTLPRTESEKNPTYFAQAGIYAYILQNFYFNNALIKVNKVGIRYIDKHNAGVYTIDIPYDNTATKKIFDSFINRCFQLDAFIGTNDLPQAEPMKWCKYCTYRARCTADVILEEGVPSFSMKMLEDMYKKFTGKNAIWRGNYTKAYKDYIKAFKIDE